MYLRFVLADYCHDSRAECGFFLEAYRVRDDAEHRQKWIFNELRRELRWFDDALDVPKWFYKRLGRHDYRSGICWFRSSANEHINRARYVAWLMSERGTCVKMVKTDHLRQVIWQDEHQVVSVAKKNTPRAFQ